MDDVALVARCFRISRPFSILPEMIKRGTGTPGNQNLAEGVGSRLCGDTNSKYLFRPPILDDYHVIKKGRHTCRDV